VTHGLKWSTGAIALAVIVAAVAVSPALGGPSLRKLVKNEVAKQIGKATGPAGSDGAPGTNGAPGTARAYGRVSSDGVLSRSKNVAGVTRPFAHYYCIELAAAIDASATGLVATPDSNGDSTGTGIPGSKTAHVEWISNAPDCAAGQLEVRTFEVSSGTTEAADPQGGTVDVPIYHIENEPKAFFFVVP
jgi:hypothetical protein